MSVHEQTKVCVTCGRVIEWRRKWARNWEEIRYCSKGCRRALDAIDLALEEAIQSLLDQRAAGKTICPSEAARAVDAADMSALMERTRCAARRLQARGALVITQGGRPVDPSTAKGPIRLRRP